MACIMFRTFFVLDSIGFLQEEVWHWFQEHELQARRWTGQNIWQEGSGQSLSQNRCGGQNTARLQPLTPERIS